MVALPQYTQEVPDLKIVPKAEQSGRMTNTGYGVFFINEASNGFEVSVMVDEDRGSDQAYQEVFIPYSVISRNDLQRFLALEPFARQILSEGGVDALSADSLGAQKLSSRES